MLSQSGFVLSLLTIVAGTGGGYLAGRELLLSSGIFVSPLLPMVTPIIVMTFLSLMKYGIEARKVLHRNRDLIEAQDAIIRSMSALAEAHDAETGWHLLRTQHYVETLARHLATLPHYRDLDEAGIDLLSKSAPLHDIGKVGIPDHILNKPGPLTEEEIDIMKTHTLIGAHALATAIDGTVHPENLDFLHYAQQMIESHHEKWDGSGYPHGLSGTDIPLAGRLMALADVYDALVFTRVYKKKISHAEAKEIILNETGRHFDPEVIAAFVAKDEEFIRISRKFADEKRSGRVKRKAP
jgi:adenylate cyclase